MFSKDRAALRAPLRGRAAFLSALIVIGVGWAGVLTLLLKRNGSEGTLDVGSVSAKEPAPLLAPAPSVAPIPRRPPLRALVVEHDDLSLFGTTRHLLRATIKTGLTTEQMRRCIDAVLDEERMTHPQVDSASVYLYEEPVYTRYTGRATPLEAANAQGTWAPGGDWALPARRLSGQDNRTVYKLPQR